MESTISDIQSLVTTENLSSLSEESLSLILDLLKGKPKPLSHVKMLKGCERFCGDFLLSIDNILFNANKVSKKDAVRIARSEEYSPYVLILPQQQFEGLFMDKDVTKTSKKG